MSNSAMRRLVDGALAVVMVVWVGALVARLGWLPWVGMLSTKLVLIVFGTGLVIACAILWLAEQRRLLSLPAGTAHFIKIALVGSVIGAGAAAASQAFQSSTRTLRVEQLVLVESDGKGAPVRPLRVRAGGTVGPSDDITFVAMLAGLQLNEQESCLADIAYYLEGGATSGTAGRADFEWYEITGPLDLWKTRGYAAADFAALGGIPRGSRPVIMTLTDQANAGAGKLMLRVIAHDRISDELAMSTVPIVIR